MTLPNAGTLDPTSAANVINAFNSSLVTSVNQRYPSRDIEGTTVPFEGPTGIVSARQLTLAARWSF